MSPFVITAELWLIMGTFFLASVIVAFHIASTTTPLVSPSRMEEPINEVIPRPPSPQAVHPAQLPVQTAEQAVNIMRAASPVERHAESVSRLAEAITLIRAEQVRTTPPIRLIHMTPSKVDTLYVKPAARH